MDRQGEKCAWPSHLESSFGWTEKAGLPFERREMLNGKLGASVVNQRNPTLEARKGENQGKEEHSGRLTSYHKEPESNLRSLLKYGIGPGLKQ